MFVEHKEAGEVTEAPAKVLKLSEAIRVGCQIRKRQCRLAFFREGAGYERSSCALGAAWEGWGGSEEDTPATDTDDAPKAFGVPRHVLMRITYMNDFQNYSREQIADWLEAQGY